MRLMSAIVGMTLAMMVVGAEGWAQTPAPGFGFFRCSCGPSNQFRVPTPSALSNVAVTSWSGSVYALSDPDARLKARNACYAETRSNAVICDTCLCRK